MVSSRQDANATIAKHHENLLKVGRHAQVRIYVSVHL